MSLACGRPLLFWCCARSTSSRHLSMPSMMSGSRVDGLCCSGQQGRECCGWCWSCLTWCRPFCGMFVVVLCDGRDACACCLGWCSQVGCLVTGGVRAFCCTLHLDVIFGAQCVGDYVWLSVNVCYWRSAGAEGWCRARAHLERWGDPRGDVHIRAVSAHVPGSLVNVPCQRARARSSATAVVAGFLFRAVGRECLLVWLPSVRIAISRAPGALVT